MVEDLRFMGLWGGGAAGLLFVDFFPDTGMEELLGLLVRHREVSLVGAQHDSWQDRVVDFW